MAPRSNTSYIILALFFVLAIFSRSSKAHGRYHRLKETNLIFYFQDFYSGSNATSEIVTGIAGKVWSFQSFGTLSVTNDRVTTGPNKESPQIGRAQGIQVATSPDGVDNIMMWYIVFTNKKYNGSTLELQGLALNSFSPYEVAVTGGTGKFRFATGFATLTLVSVDQNLFYDLTLCNITVLHY